MKTSQYYSICSLLWLVASHTASTSLGCVVESLLCLAFGTAALVATYREK